MAIPPPPFPQPEDEIQRIEQAAKDKVKAELESVKNAAINESINLAIQIAMNGMPQPLGVTALLLANAIYAAMKMPAFPTSVPSPNADPAKTYALMVAFAIVQIIWCFIKRLLNPLPIIGVFFPLCDETTQTLPNGQVRNIEDEIARIQSENKLKQAQNYAQNQKDISTTGVSGAVSLSPTDTNTIPAKGGTFEEYIAKTAAAATPMANMLSTPTTDIGADLGLNKKQGTSADISNTTAIANTTSNQPERENIKVSPNGDVGVSSNELRNLFGL